MATTQSHKASKGTLAAIAVAASVLLPVVTALALPAHAAMLAPLALVVPFVSMTWLETATLPHAGPLAQN